MRFRNFRSPRARFLVGFVLLLILFYLAMAIRPVDRHVVRPFTHFIAIASAQVLTVLGEPSVVSGTVLRAGGFAVDIQNGCNGLEAVLLFVAAVLAFPAPIRAKLIAVLAGFAAIEGFNFVRVVSLVLLGKYKPELFETFHLAFWQTVMMALAIVMFLVWSGRLAKTPNRSSAH